MLRSYARTALPFVAGLFVACTIVQVFLAGLGVFDDPRSFISHREFGYTFSWLILVIVILAVAGRFGRRIIGPALLIGLLFVLQSVFVALRGELPMLAALHPLNGFLILGTGVVVTREAWRLRQAPGPASTMAAIGGSTGQAEVQPR